MTAAVVVDQVFLGDHVCLAYDDGSAGLDAPRRRALALPWQAA
ncbi:hypothetical protein ACVCAH_19685 [Micromonospora sp. LZ34]